MAGDLYGHLATGATTVCRAWQVVRRDGTSIGFTDHDRDLSFGGVAFKANSGLTAQALAQSTGLSVDNSEAIGALSDLSVTEADILTGRFDGAEVKAWLVNWADPAERLMQFRGTLGEMVRAGGAFRAELRGLAEAMNQPHGRVYQRDCAAVLGDEACGFDLTAPGYFLERAAARVEAGQVFRFDSFVGYEDRWFDRGRMTVLSGAAAGLVGVIKNDRIKLAGREIELWQDLGAPVKRGDLLRFEAGCDKRAVTCRVKFQNFAKFRGFPHIPGEDWLSAFPSRGG